MQQQIRKVNVRQRKRKKPFKSLLTLTKFFIENDPTKKLLKFMAEGNKKLRKHEMEMMKLMLANCILLQQCLFITTVLLQMEIPLVFSKFLIIKITSLQKEKDKNSFYNMLQTPLS